MLALCTHATATNTHPMPNSSQLVFPTIIAPLLDSNDTTVASKGEVKPSSILEAHVVGNDLVHILSFTATDRPARGPAPEEGYGVLPAMGRSAFTDAASAEIARCRRETR